jgi:hypothetical protein
MDKGILSTTQEPLQQWVKPEVQLISINNDTLGATGDTGDGGGGSKS